MIGLWVSFRTTDGKICEIEFFGADFHKNDIEELCYVFAHSYIRYFIAREPHFIRR